MSAENAGTPESTMVRARSESTAAKAGWARAGRGLLGLVVFLLVAESVSRFQLIPTTWLPPMSRVIAAVGELLVDPEFLGHILATLGDWLLGLAIATVAASLLGLVLGMVPGLNNAVRILIEFLRPIPSVAVIPLMILLLGGDSTSKISMVVYSCAWPILLNTIYGLRSVDPLAKDTARVFGFGPTAVALRVQLPSAAPFIATGIKVSAAIGLIVAVSSELLGAGAAGIGYYIGEIGDGYDSTHLVFAAATVAGLLGIVVNSTLDRLERRIFRWRDLEAA